MSQPEYSTQTMSMIEESDFSEIFTQDPTSDLEKPVTKPALPNIKPSDPKFWEQPDVVKLTGDFLCRYTEYDDMMYFNFGKRNLSNGSVSRATFTRLEADKVYKFLKDTMAQITAKKGKLINMFDGDTEVAEMDRDNPEFWKPGAFLFTSRNIKIRVQFLSYMGRYAFHFLKPNYNVQKYPVWAGSRLIVRQVELTEIMEYMKRQMQAKK